MPSLSDEFPLDPEICYLNHAAVSPWPRRTARAIESFAEQNLHRGAADYPRWLEVEQRLRERLARLINAMGPDDIALLKNTSEGLSLIAGGLAWRRGDNVVGISDDFPSNRVIWESLADRGVEFRGIGINCTRDPERAIRQACDAHTRLLAVSSVHYATGLRLDLAQLGAFCRREGILFSVDAIQSLGALPLDLAQVQADFVCADGHKWMLGPEGTALFYCRPQLRDQLRLQQFGWHMLEHPSDFARREWRPSRTATRFECGSPNMLGIHGLEASLSLLEEIGLEEIERRILKNLAYLMERMRDIPNIVFATPEQEGRRSGILNFRVDGLDPDRLHQGLMARGVICAARGGGIRFSPHFYTEEGRMDRAIGILLQVIQSIK